MTLALGGALDWLAERLQPSGDAALRGLEQDLSHEATPDRAWWRVCETAWALGFVELRMVPAPEVAHLWAERHDFAPRPWPLLDRSESRPSAQSIWAFGLTVGGRTIGTVTARRRLGRVDFEPLRFVAALQALAMRFAVVREASGDRSLAAGAAPGVGATVALPGPSPGA